eukprot:1126453-Prorocentrum_minimum.AAC.1
MLLWICPPCLWIHLSCLGFTPQTSGPQRLPRRLAPQATCSRGALLVTLGKRESDRECHRARRPSRAVIAARWRAGRDRHGRLDRRSDRSQQTATHERAAPLRVLIDLPLHALDVGCNRQRKQAADPIPSALLPVV